MTSHGGLKPVLMGELFHRKKEVCGGGGGGGLSTDAAFHKV